LNQGGSGSGASWSWEAACWGGVPLIGVILGNGAASVNGGKVSRRPNPANQARLKWWERSPPAQRQGPSAKVRTLALMAHNVDVDGEIVPVVVDVPLTLELGASHTECRPLSHVPAP
jgi:hypothetical protein